MRALEFGERVSVDTANVLKRGALQHKGMSVIMHWPSANTGYSHAGGEMHMEGWQRASERTFWHPAPRIREGIYIGYRTVSDGNTEWLGNEEGNGYYGLVYYRVAVVVLGEREKPVFVFESDVTPCAR